jgi:hypothetical protein
MVPPGDVAGGECWGLPLVPELEAEGWTALQ